MAKKRKPRNKVQKPIVIDENILAQVMPGMLKSADELYKYDNALSEADPIGVFHFGNIVATTMITVQSSELLLKYKLQQEGKTIEKNHELGKLFKSLSEESQKEIRNTFQKRVSSLTFTLPKGWETVDSILQNANDALVFWRYVVAINNPKHELKTIYPYLLFIVTLSIYDTTPIVNMYFKREEVTDPELKAKIFGRSIDEQK